MPIPVSFPLHPSLKDAEVQAYLADREFPDPNWTILTLECFPLQEEFSSNEIQINPTATIPSCKTFPELMNQVNDNNFKNDWRQMHKEFQCPGNVLHDGVVAVGLIWISFEENSSCKGKHSKVNIVQLGSGNSLSAR